MTRLTKQQQIDQLQHHLTRQSADLGDTIATLLGEVQQRNVVLAQYRRAHGVTCKCETCRIAEALIHTSPALHTPEALAAHSVQVPATVSAEPEPESYAPLIPFQPLPATLAPANPSGYDRMGAYARLAAQVQAAGLSAEDAAQLDELAKLQRDGGGGAYRIEDEE